MSIQSSREPGARDQPGVHAPQEPTVAVTDLSPGDEAPEGTPGTGENICPQCGGSGNLNGEKCSFCSGTGLVTVGIGGA